MDAGIYLALKPTPHAIQQTRALFCGKHDPLYPPLTTTLSGTSPAQSVKACMISMLPGRTGSQGA
eukprot:scaffold33131_cov13-Tisochrysis_lutea.AAC.1